MKTIICKQIERLHRYVFDNVYVSDNRAWGAKYEKKPLHPYATKLLKICAKLYPDYRSHLRKTYPTDKRYLRYTIL